MLISNRFRYSNAYRTSIEAKIKTPLNVHCIFFHIHFIYSLYLFFFLSFSLIICFFFFLQKDLNVYIKWQKSKNKEQKKIQVLL